MNASGASRITVDLASRTRFSGRTAPGKVVVGVGAALGDECKAATAFRVISHLLGNGLAPQDIIAARFNGGHNRWGFVRNGADPHFHGAKLSVNMLPAGILMPGIDAYLGRNVLFFPAAARDELSVLQDNYEMSGIFSRYRISAQAPLLLNPHVVLGKMYDAARAVAEGTNSTTGKGIWYGLQDARRDDYLRAGDLLEAGTLERKLTALIPSWVEQAEALLAQNPAVAKLYRAKQFTLPVLMNIYSGFGEIFAGNIVREDRPSYLPQALKAGKVVYLEGSQGAMLHPAKGLSTQYCTSTDPSVASLEESTGIDLDKYPHEVLGLFRMCAITRHGPGPLPTETRESLFNERWGDLHCLEDAWQLPFRVGFLDLNLLRASARVNPYTGWAASWLDGLDGLERVPVCDYYSYIGDPRKLESLPAGSWTKVGEEYRLFESVTDLPASDIVPHIEWLPGWPQTPVAGMDRAEQLPGAARSLIAFVEEKLNMPGSIAMLGTGEDNSHTIFLRDL